MKREDVIKLVNAGFSKEEIVGLLKDTPAEETKEETPETPETKEALTSDNMAVMTEGVSKAIIEALQKQNIFNSRMPQEEQKSGEDILATVLDLIDEE